MSCSSIPECPHLLHPIMINFGEPLWSIPSDLPHLRSPGCLVPWTPHPRHFCIGVFENRVCTCVSGLPFTSQSSGGNRTSSRGRKPDFGRYFHRIFKLNFVKTVRQQPTHRLNNGLTAHCSCEMVFKLGITLVGIQGDTTQSSAVYRRR